MAAAIVASTAVLSNSALADTYVNGYYRGNGTYVNPHFRSAPNSVQSDNYGSWYSKSYRDRPVAPVQQTECEPYFNGYTYTIRCN